MKADDVVIGAVYNARVSGAFVKVKVLDRVKGKFLLRNLTTGRDLDKMRTAAFLRSPHVAPKA